MHLSTNTVCYIHLTRCRLMLCKLHSEVLCITVRWLHKQSYCTISLSGVSRSIDQCSRHAPRHYPGPPGEVNDPTSKLNSKRQHTRAKSKNLSHSTKAESSKNKQPQEHLAVGPVLRILQLNVEGLSAARQSLIKVLASQHSIEYLPPRNPHWHRRSRLLHQHWL